MTLPDCFGSLPDRDDEAHLHFFPLTPLPLGVFCRREVEAEGSAAAFCYVGTPGHATGNCLALTLAGDKEDRRFTHTPTPATRARVLVHALTHSPPVPNRHQLFTAGASETFDFASLAEDTKQVRDEASRPAASLHICRNSHHRLTKCV
jgi:hypothetical protein